MWCPRCGGDTRVLETDKSDETVTRVRWCRNGQCRWLFETHEVVTGGVVRQDPPARYATLMQDGWKNSLLQAECGQCPGQAGKPEHGGPEALHGAAAGASVKGAGMCTVRDRGKSATKKASRKSEPGSRKRIEKR